jgi:hypothetical protein
MGYTTYILSKICMPYKLKDAVRHKFKKKNYNNRDWKTYEAGLRNQGDLTIWFSEDAIAAWNSPVPDIRKRGRQRKYSDLAIETAYTIGLVYKKRLRQTGCGAQIKKWS